MQSLVFDPRERLSSNRSRSFSDSTLTVALPRPVANVYTSDGDVPISQLRVQILGVEGQVETEGRPVEANRAGIRKRVLLRVAVDSRQLGKSLNLGEEPMVQIEAALCSLSISNNGDVEEIELPPKSPKRLNPKMPRIM